MKSEIIYFKIRVDGVDIPSSFINNNACYKSIDDAIQHIEDGWLEFSNTCFLHRCGRKVINDYTRTDIFGYFHQITVLDENGFVRVIKLAVDKLRLILR